MPHARCGKVAKIKAKPASLGIFRDSAFCRKCRIRHFRHSWAVAALEACPCGYDQVNQHVLAVSTYLGHAKLASTYVYLHTTPQLLANIAARCEQVAQEVGP
jgi:integrase